MIVDLRLAVHMLVRDPAHALVAILGLAIGLALCLLLLAYSRHSWTYDRHVPDIDEVYVVKHRRNWELNKPWTDQMPMAMREPAKALPGVADVTGYLNWFPLNVERPGGLQPIRGLAVLPGFTRMMGLKALQGDLDATLDSADAIALTQAGAMRLLGTDQVLGQELTLRLDAADVTQATVRIGAILPTPPANTTIPYELLHGLNLPLLPSWAKEEALYGKMGFQGGYVLLKLAPGASPTQVTAALQDMADHSPLAALVPEPVKAHAGKDKFTEVKLSPLAHAYLDNEVTPNVFSMDSPRGDARAISSVAAIGVLLLTLAGFNYVNLSLVRVLRRQREITLRKALGLSQRRVVRQFVTESLVVSLLASVLGVTLAALALPAFGEMMARDLRGVWTPAYVAGALGVALFVGLLTAIYPAWVSLRVRPANLLAGRGGVESRSSRRLRLVFSTSQLALALALAGVTLAVALQTRHAMTAPLGFDPSPLLVARLPIGMSADYTGEAKALREALAQHPAIASVAVSNDTLGQTREIWSTDFRRPGGPLVFLEVKAVSANFFETHGIAPLAGRLFTRDETGKESTSPLVLDEEAARLLGFSSPALAPGQPLQVRGMQMNMEDHEIIGIAPPIRLTSLRETPRAVVYMVSSAGPVLTVRSRDSLVAAEQAMRELWPRYLTNAIPYIRRASDIYAESYADDARLARLLALCTLAAMLIAACGAYVLATDTVRRRTREIALRKLLGAQRRHIGVLVARDMGRMLLIAAAAGLPVGALATANYLSGYLEHTPLAYVGIAASLVITGAVVAIAAARQMRIAARLRPAQVLRG